MVPRKKKEGSEGAKLRDLFGYRLLFKSIDMSFNLIHKTCIKPDLIVGIVPQKKEEGSEGGKLFKSTL